MPHQICAVVVMIVQTYKSVAFPIEMLEGVNFNPISTRLLDPYTTRGGGKAHCARPYNSKIFVMNAIKP